MLIPAKLFLYYKFLLKSWKSIFLNNKIVFFGWESMIPTYLLGFIFQAEEKKKREEKEKQLLERKYTLPDTPSILVHPSASAKGGKFECTITNLSVLLDYRPEDTKEHSFEVSV